MSKIFNILLVVAGIFALIYAFDYFSPVKISSFLSGTGLEGGTCLKVTNIDTADMEPILSQGDSVVFNKCIKGKKDNLGKGAVVLIEKGYFEKNEIRVVRRKVQRASGDYYQVATVANPNEIEEVAPANIIALYEKP